MGEDPSQFGEIQADVKRIRAELIKCKLIWKDLN